jgi:hypothetical protein
VLDLGSPPRCWVGVLLELHLFAGLEFEVGKVPESEVDDEVDSVIEVVVLDLGVQGGKVEGVEVDVAAFVAGDVHG